MEKTFRCPTCGKLWWAELASISHTISRGDRLCSNCGCRESLDPAWANGRRIGLMRAKAASAVLKQRNAGKGA